MVNSVAVAEYYLEDLRKQTGLSDSQIIDGLTNIGAPCEANGLVLVVELTPNRPDWFSLEGVCRSLLEYYKQKSFSYAASKSNYEVIVDPSVSKVRPYTVCAVVTGLSFTEREIEYLIQLQEKLVTTLGRQAKKFGIGVYPLEHISFPISYTTLPKEKIRFTPLNYEGKEATADEILQNHVKGKAHGKVLFGHDRYPVFLDASKNIMCLIPIINSEKTGKVTTQTKDVFIEVTGIEEHAIRDALNIVVCSLCDKKGKAHSVKVTYGKKSIVTPDLSSKKMKVKREDVEKLLGISLPVATYKKYLSMMGHSLDGDDVLCPPYRSDIMAWVDVAEDVAIAHGYNTFEPKLPSFYSEGKQIETYFGFDAALKGMGFLEIVTFVLTNDAALAKVGGKGVKVLNPATEDYTTLRNTMASSLLEVVATNKTKGLPQKFYEIGSVYVSNKTQKQIVFGVVDNSVSFSQFQGYVQRLLEENGCDYSFEKGSKEFLSQCAIVNSSKISGFFGTVKKEVALSFGFEFEVAMAVLELK